jgi:general secretion pathway protein F
MILAHFRFEAIDRAGARISGTIEAGTRAQALDQLLANGSTPTALRAADNTKPAFFSQFLRPRTFDHVLFLRELGLLLKAGLTVERALITLKGLASNGSQAQRMQQLLDRVRGGEALSQAIGSIVTEAPRYVARLMAAGEASGKLGEVTVRLAAGLSRNRALRDKAISSATYPAVLLLTMAVVLYVVFSSVLPRLTPMFRAAGAALPLATRLLLGFGNFLHDFGWLLVLAMILIAASARYCWRRPDYRLRIDAVLMSRRFFFGLPNGIEAARYCRNLQTMLEGGLSLDRVLTAAEDGATNTAFRARMAHIRGSVAGGEQLRLAFERSRILPPVVVELAAVGEETGRLAAMLGEAADLLDQDIERRLERLSALVLPIATLAMGGLVAAIMTGIVTGILAVNDLVR